MSEIWTEEFKAKLVKELRKRRDPDRVYKQIRKTQLEERQLRIGG